MQTCEKEIETISAIHSDASNTNLALDVHTNGCYFDEAPGKLFLCCIMQSYVTFQMSKVNVRSCTLHACCW